MLGIWAWFCSPCVNLSSTEDPKWFWRQFGRLACVCLMQALLADSLSFLMSVNPVPFSVLPSGVSASNMHNCVSAAPVVSRVVRLDDTDIWDRIAVHEYIWLVVTLWSWMFSRLGFNSMFLEFPLTNIQILTVCDLSTVIFECHSFVIVFLNTFGIELTLFDLVDQLVHRCFSLHFIVSGHINLLICEVSLEECNIIEKFAVLQGVTTFPHATHCFSLSSSCNLHSWGSLLCWTAWRSCHWGNQQISLALTLFQQGCFH